MTASKTTVRTFTTGYGYTLQEIIDARGRLMREREAALATLEALPTGALISGQLKAIAIDAIQEANENRMRDLEILQNAAMFWMAEMERQAPSISYAAINAVPVDNAGNNYLALPSNPDGFTRLGFQYVISPTFNNHGECTGSGVRFTWGIDRENTHRLYPTNSDGDQITYWWSLDEARGDAARHLRGLGWTVTE
jgi:hypothetical protein